MNQSFHEIEHYLRKDVGLDPNATPGLLRRAVERRMRENNIAVSSEYFQLLKKSKDEFDCLLEQLLVSETWFFRYPEAYQYLKRHTVEQFVASESNARNQRRRYRILSVPCSTGEEPYSIAMTLIDAGLQPERFLIDAADVNSLALQKARTALYGQNSFRGTDLVYRDRYFEKQDSQYQLNISIRPLVKFFPWNVLQPPPRDVKPHYDIIFCRNLFIYFHREAQRKMIATLKELLDPQGLLFAGHAEAGHLLSPAFHPIPPMKAFVHCKQ